MKSGQYDDTDSSSMPLSQCDFSLGGPETGDLIKELLQLGKIFTLKFTVTDLANFCVTPLFRRPQGSHGCLEKQNHPLSSNLVVWCTKIGPKTKKV